MSVFTPEWITAAATALTFFAAVASGIGAMRAVRLQQHQSDPVVEVVCSGLKAGLVYMHVTVRNRSPSVLMIRSATIRSPRGAQIADRRPRPPQAKVPPFSSSALLTVELGAIDSRDHHLQKPVAYLAFQIQVPSGWSGGKVRLQLSIEEMSPIIRTRTITIERSVRAITSKQTDEKANSQA